MQVRQLFYRLKTALYTFKKEQRNGNNYFRAQSAMDIQQTPVICFEHFRRANPTAAMAEVIYRYEPRPNEDGFTSMCTVLLFISAAINDRIYSQNVQKGVDK